MGKIKLPPLETLTRKTPPRGMWNSPPGHHGARPQEGRFGGLGVCQAGRLGKMMTELYI